jgi:hypothetical protein
MMMKTMTMMMKMMMKMTMSMTMMMTTMTPMMKMTMMMMMITMMALTMMMMTMMRMEMTKIKKNTMMMIMTMVTMMMRRRTTMTMLTMVIEMTKMTMTMTMMMNEHGRGGETPLVQRHRRQRQIRTPVLRGRLRTTGASEGATFTQEQSLSKEMELENPAHLTRKLPKTGCQVSVFHKWKNLLFIISNRLGWGNTPSL